MERTVREENERVVHVQGSGLGDRKVEMLTMKNRASEKEPSCDRAKGEKK